MARKKTETAPEAKREVLQARVNSHDLRMIADIIEYRNIRSATEVLHYLIQEEHRRIARKLEKERKAKIQGPTP